MEDRRKLIDAVWNATKKGNEAKIKKLKEQFPDKVDWIDRLVENHKHILSVYY